MLASFHKKIQKNEVTITSNKNANWKNKSHNFHKESKEVLDFGLAIGVWNMLRNWAKVVKVFDHLVKYFNQSERVEGKESIVRK